MVLKNPKNIYIHIMNYKDFFPKREAVDAKLKNAPDLSKIDKEQLKIGAKHELEHTANSKTATIIAAQHLAEDPNYYQKLNKVGLEEKELIKGVNLDDNCCEDGLPRREDGALDIEHDGRPIKLAKIVQFGAIGGGPADGEVSGYTNVGTTGNVPPEEKDEAGPDVSQQGDKEPITAGGKSVESGLASKTVGGEVSPGEGQEQGGPNTKGNISGTPKLGGEGDGGVTLSLQEAKTKLRSMVKEALKEITFNKETGKWVRLNEGHKAGCECGFCKNKGTFGKKKDDDKEEKKDVDETVDMKMGPSYKVADRQYRTSDDDQARKVMYEPPITEVYDEEEECALQERYTSLVNSQRNLTEAELDELKDLGLKLEKMQALRRNFGSSQGGTEPNLFNEAKKKRWIQKATKGMRKDKPCTGKKFGGPTCPPGSKRYNLAKTFKKMAKKDESINETENPAEMKMGPSYKVQSHQYKCVNCNPARRNQFDPEMSEAAEEQEEAGLTSEVSAPGQEDWILKNKERFIKQYGKEKGLEVLYGKAWNRAKGRDESVSEAGGAAVQHSSARVSNYAPQLPKNRHRGDIDEVKKKAVSEVADNKLTVIHDLIRHIKEKYPGITTDKLIPLVCVLFKQQTGWQADREAVKQAIDQLS